MRPLLHLLAVGYTNNYNTGPTTGASSSASAGLVVTYVVFYGILLILVLTAFWRIFTKAGKPGWAAIVPFYSQWVLAEISGKPGWWGLLLFIPIVNIVISLILAIGIARNFSKSTAFGVIGLWLFSTIGYLILAFGAAEYKQTSVGLQSKSSDGSTK